MPLGQQPASLGIDAMERLVASIRVLREVTVDGDATARWALIDVVLKVFAIALTVNMLKELLSVMNGDTCEWDTIATLKADFGSTRFELHGIPVKRRAFIRRRGAKRQGHPAA